MENCDKTRTFADEKYETHLEVCRIIRTQGHGKRVAYLETHHSLLRKNAFQVRDAHAGADTNSKVTETRDFQRMATKNESIACRRRSSSSQGGRNEDRSRCIRQMSTPGEIQRMEAGGDRRDP